MLIAFLSDMAEDERLRILARCMGGMAAAKAKGIKLGRKPKLTGHHRVYVASRSDVYVMPSASSVPTAAMRCLSIDPRGDVSD